MEKASLKYKRFSPKNSLRCGLSFSTGKIYTLMVKIFIKKRGLDVLISTKDFYFARLKFLSGKRGVDEVSEFRQEKECG
jgi:hypothetical protein